MTKWKYSYRPERSRSNLRLPAIRTCLAVWICCCFVMVQVGSVSALPTLTPTSTPTSQPPKNVASITSGSDNQSESPHEIKRWWWDDEESTTRKSANQSEVIIVDGTKTRTLKVLAETSTSKPKRQTKSRKPSKTTTPEYQVLTVYNAPPNSSKAAGKKPAKTTSFRLVTVYNKATGLSNATGRKGDVLSPYQVYTVFNKPTSTRIRKGEAKAGNLPIYQMLLAFIFVVGVGGGVLWWFNNKKMLKIQHQRKVAARAKREQLEWEKEMRQIPDPELEKQADHLVENLPYAPEGLFYETANPLDLDNQGDIADERWDDRRREEEHRHNHHDSQHSHQRPPKSGRRPLSDTGQSFYEQQSFRAVLPPY